MMALEGWSGLVAVNECHGAGYGKVRERRLAEQGIWVLIQALGGLRSEQAFHEYLSGSRTGRHGWQGRRAEE